MKRIKNFVPEEIYQLVPVKEGDQSYGQKIHELYRKSMIYALDKLFVSGASGMVLGDDSPCSVELLHRAISSQLFSRPEDYNDENIKLSDGFHLSADCDVSMLKRPVLDYRPVRFQGDYEKLLGSDYPREGTGTMAVCLAGNMALNGILPLDKDRVAVLVSIRIASMAPDKKHKKPWLAVEFDLYVHKKAFCLMALPRDKKTGYVPLDDLEALAREAL